ncbi:hypothetical protein LTS08_003203 [Lithohypha guttulata]|uniref:uncharacterized protein n=1 Tax=Lithohypha guttulata TaxID=1690604 RepID=UPI002DE07242|nr:hypothetical protein LTS08_003203 [Lithohypha guttulata]
MTDVRALLAAERQSRRISHPHLTYTKNGALLCNVCNLNVKSEQLWPGHLKSLNHRKAAQKQPEQPVARTAKRKIDSVEDDEEVPCNYEVDSRKRPKASAQEVVPQHDVPITEETTVDEATVQDAEAPEPRHVPPVEDPEPQPPLVPPIDEDEWAAFEKEVAPLTQPSYAAGATIEAAPVSAADLADRQKQNSVEQREDEAEVEKEEESNRMFEEFEVMEEMEDRVNRLRARREALRSNHTTTEHSIAPDEERHTNHDEVSAEPTQEVEAELSDDDEEDDWYG